MANGLVLSRSVDSGPALPAVIAAAGERASNRFVEFFTATIRNPNTPLAYGRAVGSFLAWCEERGLVFDRIGAVIVAGYVETLLANGMAKPSLRAFDRGVTRSRELLHEDAASLAVCTS
jgi:hypothetical protein